MNSIIVIAASAGGLHPIVQIVSALPVSCRASVFVVQHIGAQRSLLPDVLASRSQLAVSFGQDGEEIEPGHIYVAPPDHHMRVSLGLIHLDRGPKVHFARPAADPLFVSAAEAYGARVIAIVLSGGGSDGAAGLQAIKAHGGLALVQAPAEAAVSEMPRAALMRDHPDAQLTAEQIASRVAQHCDHAD